MAIRQPIVTVAGHVDHGKTTILDNIRGTKVYDTEAGGITQKISFTKVPLDNVKKRCSLIDKNNVKLDFPGFLFIDTPGHAAFSHLRKRGGNLADLAILVIDINEGIMPQTAEVIEILKINKIPFIIALNKIDKISGWRKQSEILTENIDKQGTNIKLQFEEKLLTLVGSLHHHGFNAKPYYEVTDFSSQLALVPCSGKTGEGISELIFMLAGISQKFLKKNLKLGDVAKGVVLEIKKEKSTEYLEAIIYDGELKSNDELAIASFSDPIIAKIRVLEEIMPISTKFKPAIKVKAANGLRMQLINAEGVLPGMPFTIFKNNLEEIKKEFKKETNIVKTDEEGIIIKADSLGSLEALSTLLREKRVKIVRSGIGSINKKDLISAQTNLNTNPLNAVILGFNVEEDNEVKELNKSVKIIKHEVIYKLIEELLEFQEQKKNEIQRETMLKLASICKLKILHQYVFRNNHPAVFGVAIEAGKIRKGTSLMDENGENIAKIKEIQENQKKIEIAKKGQEIAISLPGTTFDRQLKEINYLYSDISESQFKAFKDNKSVLSQDEIQTLQKIAQIKRAKKPTWGV